MRAATNKPWYLEGRLLLLVAVLAFAALNGEEWMAIPKQLVCVVLKLDCVQLVRCKCEMQL